MAHISKKELPKQTKHHIEHEFLRTMRKGGSGVLVEILTDVELLMLAKRFMTIVLLAENQSYYRINQALGVRVATSKRLHHMLISGAFSKIEKLINSSKERRDRNELIGAILRGGMPKRSYVIKKGVKLPIL